MEINVTVDGLSNAAFDKYPNIIDGNVVGKSQLRSCTYHYFSLPGTKTSLAIDPTSGGGVKSLCRIGEITTITGL